MATLQIPNHSHCLVCSKAVPFGDKTCSKKCEQEQEEQQKNRKKQMLVLYGLMAIAFAVAVAPILLSR
jgi:predicted nucleic acid-binding Zn ribbon protein